MVSDVSFVNWCAFRQLTKQRKGVLVSVADEGLGDPPPRWIQEPSVVRDRNGRPQEDPWQYTASVCVAGVHCWEILG